MSQEQLNQQDTETEATEVLEVIKEEQCSPDPSSVNMNAPKVEEEENIEPCKDCTCLERDEKLKEKMDPELVETLLREKEKRLTEEFREQLKREIDYVKERCDFILQNEQVRSSYMLREAHRERQEKVTALQTQLECKNMAGLMYVMCSERRKSKHDKMRLIEEYTNYIRDLQDILTEAQSLILHLSKGYKTAARVDHEWREKMKNVLKEFQMFVHDYAGGTLEGDQYFFDLPVLLKTEAPVLDNPIENPCESEECEGEFDLEEDTKEKPWWERMDSDCRPFLMFGDMAEFTPPQRREVLRNVKAAKTAPKKWKEYVFHEMCLRTDCANADYIKDEYPKHEPDMKWECHGQAADVDSKMSLNSRRTTRPSEDIRGTMGSLLKIMTTSSNKPSASAKATLLGARDSMEISSTTKLRERQKSDRKSADHRISQNKVVIKPPNKRRTSFFDDVRPEDTLEDFTAISDESKASKHNIDEEEDVEPGNLSPLGFVYVINGYHEKKSLQQDSLQIIRNHIRDQDHHINYEKMCPMEKCQRLQVDSFIRSLPPYMRSNPFIHFEQSFEQYETCSAEQINILKQRIEHKKAKLDHEPAIDKCPLAEWTPSVEGVAVQTSDLSMSLPPCTCRCPSPTPVSSDGRIFNVEDLFPVKLAIDMISKECLYDDRIQFNRFKILGQDSKTKINPMQETKRRVHEIQKVLKQHPSFLDIFQGNTQC